MTTRKDFLLRPAAAGLSLFGLGRGNVAEVTTRPYVLMVFTDDQSPFGILSRLPFVREFFVENGLELARIGWQLFILGSFHGDSTAFQSFLDTFATRLSAQPLSIRPGIFGGPEVSAEPGHNAAWALPALP